MPFNQKLRMMSCIVSTALVQYYLKSLLRKYCVHYTMCNATSVLGTCSKIRLPLYCGGKYVQLEGLMNVNTQQSERGVQFFCLFGWGKEAPCPPHSYICRVSTVSLLYLLPLASSFRRCACRASLRPPSSSVISNHPLKTVLLLCKKPLNSMCILS